MGWASGSDLMSEIVASISDIIDDDGIRKEVYSKLIELFGDYDCDTLDECVGEDEMFDEAYHEIFDAGVEEEIEEELWDDE